MQRQRGGLFDGVLPMARDGNEPDFVESATQGVLADIDVSDLLRIIAAIRSGLRDRSALRDLLVGFLPSIILDHVPDSYFRALGFKL